MKNYVTLGEVCSKGSSNIAQKDIEQNNGEYAIYGASGYIKNVDFYHQDNSYVAIVKDGAGIGRTMLLPAKTSVIGTMQYLIPNELVDVKYLYYAVTYMNLSKYFSGATIPHIYFKDYKKEKLPLPTISQQQVIINNLSKIDKLIDRYYVIINYTRSEYGLANYVWCEDSKSGYQFWKALFKEIRPDFIIETQINNSRLAKKAGKITDDGNTYYIIMDTAVDNADVQRESMRLNKYIAGKNNIKLIMVHSFEFTLLSFKYLDNWVFAENDELKDRRSKLLNAKAQFVNLIRNGGSAEELNEFKSVYDSIDKKNTEKIAAKLLFEITRNTGFETDKSKIGDCFVNDCCEWNDRQANDVCGLDKNKLNASEKMEQIIRHSILNAAFKEVNLL